MGSDEEKRLGGSAPCLSVAEVNLRPTVIQFDHFLPMCVSPSEVRFELIGRCNDLFDSASITQDLVIVEVRIGGGSVAVRRTTRQPAEFGL